MFKGLTASLAIGLLVAGCGGNSKTLVSPTSSGSGTGGGGGGTTATEEMGATVGGTFTQGALSTSLPSGSQLSSGGSTSITVQFQVTKSGAPATDAIGITWTSKCPAGTVTSNPATGTNTTGSLTTTYTNNGGCTLASDTVTAAATTGATNLGSKTTASTAIPLATAVANSLVFISASPTNVGLKGTGQPSTSAVTFEVETAGGGPVAGVTVNFALSTTLGGITLVNSSATTGTNGQAVATVQAGTRATTVSVTATATTASGTFSADSNSLTVTTEIPVKSAMSLSFQGCNVQGYNHDGVIIPVTMRMKDRFSNPVPDGTAVIFSTSGGGIVGNCTTTHTASESGLCTVNWNSQNPRGPNGNGRARIIGVAVGEKDFVDSYGLGYFEGPPVPGYPTDDKFTDIPTDPYRDDLEKGSFQPGYVFYDIHNSTTWLGPSGKYVGLLCGGPNPTTLPASCTANNSTQYVDSQQTLIMDTDANQVQNWQTGNSNPTGFNVGTSTYNTTIDVSAGSDSVLVSVVDMNGNPPASGTVVTVLNVPSGVTLGQPNSATSACDNGPAHGLGFQAFFTFTEQSGATHGAGQITVSMTSPGTSAGVGPDQTLQQIPIKY